MTGRDEPDPLAGFQGSLGHPERFVQLAFQLNGLLDQGCSISPDEAHERIRDRSLFGWLEEMYPRERYHLNLTMLDAGERRTILKVFEMTDAHWAQHNGLAVLVSYCLVVLQSPGASDDSRSNE